MVNEASAGALGVSAPAVDISGHLGQTCSHISLSVDARLVKLFVLRFELDVLRVTGDE